MRKITVNERDIKWQDSANLFLVQSNRCSAYSNEKQIKTKNLRNNIGPSWQKIYTEEKENSWLPNKNNEKTSWLSIFWLPKSWSDIIQSLHIGQWHC